MITLVVAGLAGTLLLSQLTAAPATGTAKAELGKPAPDFALKDVYAKTFKLSDFKGKPVVLEWINLKCPVSKAKHADKTMQNVLKKHAQEGVVWLAIASSHFCDQEVNRVYAAEMGLAYPILHDPDGKVGTAYDAKTTPHMYVIDKAGKLVYDGAIDDKGSTNYVDDAVKAVLAGQPVKKNKTKAYGCSVKYK